MGFFKDIIDSLIFEASDAIGVIFRNIGQTAFYIEKGLDGVLTTDTIGSLYSFISSFAVSLIILKVLYKGFFTYILWRDGDPDAPIQQTIINFVAAIAFAVSFPTAYEWYAQVSLWLIERTFALSFGSVIAEMPLSDALTKLPLTSLINGIITIIYLIMLFLLYLQFLKRSIELLALRIGFPLACLGLLDSDNGVFTSTIKVFIQVSLTTVAQLFLFSLSLSLLMTSTDVSRLLYSIAACSAAMGIPKLLQFVLLQNGGGGGAQKITSTVYMANVIRQLIPR